MQRHKTSDENIGQKGGIAVGTPNEMKKSLPVGRRQQQGTDEAPWGDAYHNTFFRNRLE